MRSQADSPTIHVSCGHNVPRVKVSVPGLQGHRYWCEDCGVYRMSGHAHSGEHAFDFLLELRDEVSRLGVTVPDPGTERGRAVVHALGARLATSPPDRRN